MEIRKETKLFGFYNNQGLGKILFFLDLLLERNTPILRDKNASLDASSFSREDDLFSVVVFKRDDELLLLLEVFFYCSQ